MTVFDLADGSIIINGTFVGVGYAGQPPHVLDAGATDLHGVGPLPVGLYSIGAPEDRPESVGAYALPLTPDPENVMFNRSGFWVHGDNPAQNETASDGCIVAGRPIREQIAADPDHTLSVVA